MGVRFYTGHATLGEHVVVKRDAGNPYDSNAIKVDNVMGHQIGHIPRQIAAKLAKYMVYAPRTYASVLLLISPFRIPETC